jgi:hypothetical protein
MSKLVGLFKKLEWTDFGTPKKSQDPAPNTVATAAFTDANFTFSVGPAAEQVPGTKKFTLKDNLEITINFKKSTSFVNDWVFRRDKSFQDALLKHEQHHYEIAGLLARDEFIDLMQLKSKQFDSTSQLQTAINMVQAKYAGKIASINKLYDDKTKSGRDAAAQQTWDGFFETAFTKERVPRVLTPDGKAYKVGLLDVLTSNGLTP